MKPDRRAQFIDTRDIVQQSDKYVREFCERYEKGDYCRYCGGFMHHTLRCPFGHGAER